MAGAALFSVLSVPLWLVFFFLFLLVFLGFFFRGLRSALCFLHFKFASKQLDDRQICSVAFAVSQLDDSAVAAVPVGETRSDRIEHFLGDGLAQKICLHLPA